MHEGRMSYHFMLFDSRLSIFHSDPNTNLFGCELCPTRGNLKFLDTALARNLLEKAHDKPISNHMDSRSNTCKDCWELHVG